MAGTTGLEPATSAVTGQHSNQLNYVPTAFLNSLPQGDDSTVHLYRLPIRLCLQAPPCMSDRRPRNCHHSAIWIVPKKARRTFLSPQVQRLRVKKLLMNDLICIRVDFLQQENRQPAGSLGSQKP